MPVPRLWLMLMLLLVGVMAGCGGGTGGEVVATEEDVMEAPADMVDPASSAP